MAEHPDFQNILNLLEKSKVEHGTDIYIRSLDVSRKFKKFSGKQNKDFVEIITLSPIFPYHFHNYILQILSELSIDKTLNIGALTPVDRALMLLQLRIANVGPELKFGDTTIDLVKHVESVKDVVVPETMTVDVDNFNLTLGFPNLKTENEFDKLLIAEIHDFRDDTPKEGREILPLVFLYNVLSFIREMSIVVDGVETDFNFSNKTVLQKIEIGNAISSNAILKIVDVIHSVFTEPLSTILTASDSNNAKHEIDLTPRFFLQ